MANDPGYGSKTQIAGFNFVCGSEHKRRVEGNRSPQVESRR